MTLPLLQCRQGGMQGWNYRNERYELRSEDGYKESMA
jgi:hypothetical protein